MAISSSSAQKGKREEKDNRIASVNVFMIDQAPLFQFSRRLLLTLGLGGSFSLLIWLTSSLSDAQPVK